MSLKDLWEYLNRYIYLPRVKDRNILVKAVRASVGAMVPGPFAYAERWDEKSERYIGLAVQNAANAPVVIGSDSVIVNFDVYSLDEAGQNLHLPDNTLRSLDYLSARSWMASDHVGERLTYIPY